MPLLQTHGSTDKQDQRNVWCGTRHPALKLHGLVEGLRHQSFPTCFLAGEVEQRSGRRVGERCGEGQGVQRRDLALCSSLTGQPGSRSNRVLDPERPLSI